MQNVALRKTVKSSVQDIKGIMIIILAEQNPHDGSWKAEHAFNNKLETVFGDNFDKLVDAIEEKMREVFEDAIQYRIVVTRTLSL